VNGVPLDHMIKQRGGLPLDVVVPLVEKIAEVLGAAHERQIIHRDLKPANVMVVGRGATIFPKLLDFGIAKLVAAQEISVERDQRPEQPVDLSISATLTSGAGMDVFGSPRYMPPEQWADPAHVSPAADIYALGVLVYETIAGRPPHDARTLADLRWAHEHEQPSPIAGIPASVNAVIAKALAKRPQDRHADALELARELREAITAKPRRPWVWIAGGVATASAISLAAFALTRHHRAAPKVKHERHRRPLVSDVVLDVSQPHGLSPDGKHFAFIDADQKIHAVDFANMTTALVPADAPVGVTWTADSRLAIVHESSVTVDGAPIVTGLGGPSSVALSRGGAAWVDGDRLIIRSDAGDRTVTHPYLDGEVAWSPDDRWLAYTAGDSLRLVRPDGTADHELYHRQLWDPQGNYSTAWLASDRLAFVDGPLAGESILAVAIDANGVGRGDPETLVSSTLKLSLLSAGGRALAYAETPLPEGFATWSLSDLKPVQDVSIGLDLLPLTIDDDGTFTFHAPGVQTGVYRWRDGGTSLIAKSASTKRPSCGDLAHLRYTGGGKLTELFADGHERVTPLEKWDLMYLLCGGDTTGLVGYRDGRGHVFVLGDGGMREVLTLDAADGVSALAPGGTTLATIPAGGSSLRLVELGTGASHEIAMPPAFQPDFITFTPSGDRLVITGAHGAEFEALLVEVAGGAPRLITSSRRWLFNPRISPDGKLLAVGWRDVTQHTTVWLLEDP
jgi:hypothetical protein